jgi:putative AdoMet-dependent methyltransferase
MLDNNGFDQWAGEYDASIEKLSNGYPFEGYYDVLGYIQNAIVDPKNTSILDLGIGTGLLTYELYKTGATIAGADFSKQMIDISACAGVLEVY